MELSNVIGRPVLSSAGEQLGYVKNAFLDKGLCKIASLVCVDGEEEEFFLPAGAILSYGDALIAQGNRIKAAYGTPSPIGKPVYDEKGILLGRACELLLDGKKGVLLVMRESGSVSCAAELLSVNETVIVHGSPVKPQNRKKRPARVVSEKKQTEKEAAPPAPNPYDSLNGMDLLGRRVRKTVRGGSGLLASAGDTVTPALLKRARADNRLLALAASTLSE